MIIVQYNIIINDIYYNIYEGAANKNVAFIT